MKILAITQARFNSSRLPGKILQEAFQGKTFLDVHLERIHKSKKINHFVVATTNEPESNRIIAIAKRNKFDYFQGDLLNVLSRFYQAAKPYAPDIVVRLTSDCPLVDANIIDLCIEKLISENLDYVSNTLKESTFPKGMDVEVFTFEALKSAYKNAITDDEKEHVTNYIWENSDLEDGIMFRGGMFNNKISYSHQRMTLDYPEDATLLKEIIRRKGVDKSWIDYVNFLEENLELQQINKLRK